MNIDLELRKGTLREASKDDNGSYLLESGEEEVYLFDDISKDVADILRNKKKLKSVDALSIVKKDDKVYFIEFKNTCHAHMPKNELYPKAHDSVCTYLLAIEPDISLKELKEKAYYIVVYNDKADTKISAIESESINTMQGILRTLSKTENPLDRVLWQLDQYEGILFKKVYTVDKQDFINILKPQIWDPT